MQTVTNHASRLDSAAALTAILSLARAGLETPTREQSVIDRSRAVLSAKRRAR